MKTLFNGKGYAIYHMEGDSEDCEQYKIFIKESCKRQAKHPTIDRDCYSQVENGIEYAHEMAKETIAEYFIAP